MASTFARHAPGRILLNVVVGGEAHEQRACGDHLDKAARYARADEFLDVVRRLWAGETVTHKGEYIDIEEASLAVPPNPIPPRTFGGSSKAAGPVAARHSDVT
jgi:alkanesulfonate monooxygenase